MAITRLGALRFIGIATDVASLPIDATLTGAIFDATDTIQKFVFDGATWQEFVAGSGEDNTGANVGAGTGTIFRDKIGVVLNFKTVIGGANISVVDNADDITISSTGISPLTTKGDMLAFSTVDARLPVGTDGQILSANSGVSLGVEWIDDVQEVFTWTANHDMNGFAAEDSKFADGTDPTKILSLDLLGMTTAITLTLQSLQSTAQTLLIPNITQADTIATEKFPQTLTLKTFESSSDFTAATGLTNFTGLGIQIQTLDMGVNLIDNVSTIAVGIINDETNALPAITITDVTAALSFNARTISDFVFDANGTGNSLDNVEVADLADAIAGELITWDNLGAPAVVAVGTSGDVLTSNGVGLPPTFQTGGGAATTFQPAYQFAVNDTVLTVQTIPNVWRLPIDFTSLASISAYVEDAPTSSNITILVKKNGTTEGTVIITPASKTASTSSFTTGSILNTDEITVEITTVGSSVAGSNLKLSIIDGLQSSTKSIQFAATMGGTDVLIETIDDVWRTPTTITTINEINAYVEVAPVGSAMVLLVKKDGVTEGTVTIADGSFVGSTAVLTSGTIDFTNEITVEVTQVGSTIAGENLKVNILGV